MARLFTAANSERFVVSELVRGVSPVSMGCWFFAVNASSDDYAMLQLTDQSSPNNFFRLGFAGARGNSDFREIMAFVGGTADSDAALTPATVLNEWHHACAVFPDVNSRTAFLDGVPALTTTTISHPTGIDAMDVGFEGDLTSGDPWDGRLAHVAVWDIALTTADVEMLAAGISPLKVRPNNLIFYAPLRLQSGDERDLVGGKTLTDVNTVTAADGPRAFAPSTSQLISLPGIQVESASGTPSITPVTASGTAEIKRNASGAATLAAILAAGTALVINAASGTPDIPTIEAAGTALVIHAASGTPNVPTIEATGMATVNAQIIATGAPIVPAVTASGTVEIIRNANGTPSIAPIESAGTAQVVKSASGAGTIPAIVGAGTAAIVNSSSGAATIAPVESFAHCRALQYRLQ